MIFIYLMTIFVIINLGSSHNLGIIGGRDALPNEFPYQVYITQQDIDNYFFLCGGIIISKNWVLSAGSCVNTTAQPSTYKLLVGLTNLSDPIHQTLTLEKIVLHPNFNSKTCVDDLSLMKVSTPFEFSDSVKAATLANKDTDSKTGVAMVSGWGVKGGFWPHPEILQVLEGNILTFEECNSTLQKIIDDTTYNINRDAISALNDDTKICTSPLEDNPNEFRGTCFGDEGSPLTKDSIVIGVTSFIIDGCGREFVPSIFTRVSAYIDWIQQNIDDNLETAMV